MISERKLFLLAFIPVILALLITLAVIVQTVDDSSQQQLYQMMSGQWQIVAYLDIPEEYSPEAHRKLLKLTESTAMRITIISPEGKILTDSALTHEEIVSAEDHTDREEVRSAALGEPIVTTRYSRSTKIQSIYYAKMLDSGNIMRIAYPADYYDHSADRLITVFFAEFILLAAIFAVVAFIVSKKISGPFREFRSALSRSDSADITLPTFNDSVMDSAVASVYLMKEELNKANVSACAVNDQLRYIINHTSEGVILINDDNEITGCNKNASDILQCRLDTVSGFMKQLTDIDVIKFFGDLPASGADAEKMYIKGKTLEISVIRIGQEKLVVMKDISAGTVYNNYKMDLVENLSHELKTPLASILGASETILKNGAMTAEARDKFLQTIYRNSLSLNKLLFDILELHKLENTTGVGIVTEITDINEIISELDELSKPLLGDKKINYKIDADTVKAHSSHILSILLNLVTNALKYSGGAEVNVSVLKEGCKIIMSVADQGPAIPKSERERIFERFYSVSQSRTRGLGKDCSGSGLGLSIVKHITRLYHGYINTETNSAGGNTFTVSFMEQPEHFKIDNVIKK